MQARDYRLNLWQEFMKHTPYIIQKDQETMGEIAGLYVENSGFLYQVYEAFIEKDRFLEDEQNEVAYERDGDDYILTLRGRECVYSEQEFRRILVSMLDLLEEPLPLGTVVDLKKSVYQNLPEIQQVDEIRMVITHRFLGSEEDSCYFPYAGVVYPTGMMGRKEVLYFTRPIIEKIVHMGYRDEKEDAYTYLMKKELVIEKGKNSIGFAPKEEIEAFNQRFRKGE